MNYKGLVDPKNKPFGNVLPFEVQVLIMFWRHCFMTNDERKKWMRNLPAFPVALEQAFQCSWHFHFPPVKNYFRLHWNENHILTFTVVRTVSDEKPSNTRYVWTLILFCNSFALCFRGLVVILFTSMTISQSFTFKQYFLNTLLF